MGACVSPYKKTHKTSAPINEVNDMQTRQLQNRDEVKEKKEFINKGYELTTKYQQNDQQKEFDRNTSVETGLQNKQNKVNYQTSQCSSVAREFQYLEEFNRTQREMQQPIKFTEENSKQQNMKKMSLSDCRDTVSLQKFTTPEYLEMYLPLQQLQVQLQYL